MKKKIIVLISIVLVIVVVIGIFSILNKVINDKFNYMTTGNIDGKTFHRLIKFKIDNEAKVQIIVYPDSGIDDGSSTHYYNFDFNNRIVTSLLESSAHSAAGAVTSYGMWEHQLIDEQILSIKQKIKEIEKLSDEENSESYHLQSYGIRTINGEIKFSYNEEAKNIIKDILKIF